MPFSPLGSPSASDFYSSLQERGLEADEDLGTDPPFLECRSGRAVLQSLAGCPYRDVAAGCIGSKVTYR